MEIVRDDGGLVARCLADDPGERPSLEALRRGLERGVRDPSPGACRAELASWLWEIRILRESPQVQAVRFEAEPAESAASSRAGGRRLAAPSIAIAAALLVAGLSAWLVAPSASDPGASAPPVAAAPLARASVVFHVEPWAEVTVAGHEPFVTPRALPLELAPGSHRVTLRHPTLGSAEYDLELTPGEHRIVLYSLPAEGS